MGKSRHHSHTRRKNTEGFSYFHCIHISVSYTHLDVYKRQVVLAPIVHHVVKLILRCIPQFAIGERIVRRTVVGFYIFPVPGEHGQRTCRTDNVIASLFVIPQPGTEPVPAVRNLFIGNIQTNQARQCRQHVDLRNKCRRFLRLCPPLPVHDKRYARAGFVCTCLLYTSRCV